MKIYKTYMESPIGMLYLFASEKGLKSIEWEDDESIEYKSSKLLNEAKKELKEYFLGKREKFTTALDIEGTDFQKRVWKELLKIPFGETISYKTLAERLKTKGYQAVGSANGRNPICVIIPCHRVIAQDGSLGGYSGGIDKKITLLELEKNS